MPYRRSQRDKKAISKIPLGLVEVSDIVSKTNLPGYDYAVTPYVGCPHACKYCYASYMRDVSGHEEEWGEFVDAKLCDKPLSPSRLASKRIFMSPVCDVYNPKEKDARVTRAALEQLSVIDCAVHVNTKSSLVVRDIDVFSRMKNLTVGISINTLDDAFRRDMDRASSIPSRLKAMEELHDAGVYTVCFISPIFPGITDWREILDATAEIADEWWFEDLNLRGAHKYEMLSYVGQVRPELESNYYRIYKLEEYEELYELEQEIVSFCEENSLAYLDAFHHPVCPGAGVIHNRREDRFLSNGDSLF